MPDCNVDCYGKCNRKIYFDGKRVLHCKKNTYQEDRKSGLLSKFYNEFIGYIAKEIVEYNNLLKNKLTEEEVEDYLKSNKFDNKEYNDFFKETSFIPNCIHFPDRNGRDKFDYLKILNLFGKIHFNYCEFYLSDLILKNTECFFQDCKFHYSWVLYNYGVLENIDNIIYQNCEFYKNVSNYTPEKLEELAVYTYSQFNYMCIFKENLSFNRSKFENRLFNTEQNNYLDDGHIKKLEFNKCTFENKFQLNKHTIEEFICTDSLFKGKFEFKENKIISFKINNSNFDKISDMFGCSFQKFNLKKSIFNNFAGFEKCVFGTEEKLEQEVAIFKYVTFKDLLNLRNTKFLSGLDIENINTQGVSNFLHIEVEFKNTNRETFKILKHSFDSTSNIIEANKFYQKEMQKMEEELKNNLLKKFPEWIIFKIHDISSRHSQNWLMPLSWIINITFIKIIFFTKELEYTTLDNILSILLVLFILCKLILYKEISNIINIIVLFGAYLIYGYLLGDFSLEIFSKNINPLSIMTGDKSLIFGVLLYKIIITYLIYQFVISIRQNTRRK